MVRGYVTTPAVLVDLEVESESCSVAVAVKLMRGRYPDSACGTPSSVTRTAARCAFSVGLLI